MYSKNLLAININVLVTSQSFLRLNVKSSLQSYRSNWYCYLGIPFIVQCFQLCTTGDERDPAPGCRHQDQEEAAHPHGGRPEVGHRAYEENN